MPSEVTLFQVASCVKIEVAGYGGTDVNRSVRVEHMMDHFCFKLRSFNVSVS